MVGICTSTPTRVQSEQRSTTERKNGATTSTSVVHAARAGLGAPSSHRAPRIGGQHRHTTCDPTLKSGQTPRRSSEKNLTVMDRHRTRATCCGYCRQRPLAHGRTQQARHARRPQVSGGVASKPRQGGSALGGRNLHHPSRPQHRNSAPTRHVLRASIEEKERRMNRDEHACCQGRAAHRRTAPSYHM